MTRTNKLSSLIATMLLLAACSPAAGEVTTIGGSDKPVSLLSLSYQVPGRSGGDQLVKLTELASTLSNGSITLVPGPAPDSSAPDTSAATIAAVRENEVQLGIVSARTFDTLGVTSFQALQAPYLVTSNDLADKVLADPLADTMLQGTAPLGVVGIGLAFDFLAYPGGFESALKGPEDYRGKVFQVRPSKANDLLTAALGARSDPRNGPDFENAVAAHEVQGSWGYFDEAQQPIAGEIFTANEPAFARANVIIVNQKVFDGLSPRQQQQLRAAAAQTRDWMATRHSDPAQAAAEYCAQRGGTIALATAAELDAMHAATAPVVSALAQDPLSATVIARIRELKRSVTSPPSPEACSGPEATTAPIPVLAPRGDQHLIDGVWRLEVSEEVLLAAGASPMDAANNSGIWTWSFKGGTFHYTEPRGRACEGTYSLDGEMFLAVVYQPIGCDNVWPLQMKRSGDRLAVSPVPGTPYGIPVSQESGLYTPEPESTSFVKDFFANPMVRVGDAP